MPRIKKSFLQQHKPGGNSSLNSEIQQTSANAIVKNDSKQDEPEDSEQNTLNLDDQSILTLKAPFPQELHILEDFEIDQILQTNSLPTNLKNETSQKQNQNNADYYENQNDSQKGQILDSQDSSFSSSQSQSKSDEDSPQKNTSQSKSRSSSSSLNKQSKHKIRRTRSVRNNKKNQIINDIYSDDKMEQRLSKRISVVQYQINNSFDIEKDDDTNSVKSNQSLKSHGASQKNKDFTTLIQKTLKTLKCLQSPNFLIKGSVFSVLSLFAGVDDIPIEFSIKEKQIDWNEAKLYINQIRQILQQNQNFESLFSHCPKISSKNLITSLRYIIQTKESIAQISSPFKSQCIHILIFIKEAIDYLMNKKKITQQLLNKKDTQDDIQIRNLLTVFQNNDDNYKKQQIQMLIRDSEHLNEKLQKRVEEKPVNHSHHTNLNADKQMKDQKQNAQIPIESANKNNKKSVILKDDNEEILKFKNFISPEKNDKIDKSLVKRNSTMQFTSMLQNQIIESKKQSIQNNESMDKKQIIKIQQIDEKPINIQTYNGKQQKINQFDDDLNQNQDSLQQFEQDKRQNLPQDMQYNLTQFQQNLYYIISHQLNQENLEKFQNLKYLHSSERLLHLGRCLIMSFEGVIQQLPTYDDDLKKELALPVNIRKYLRKIIENISNVDYQKLHQKNLIKKSLVNQIQIELEMFDKLTEKISSPDADVTDPIKIGLKQLWILYNFETQLQLYQTNVLDQDKSGKYCPIKFSKQSISQIYYEIACKWQYSPGFEYTSPYSKREKIEHHKSQNFIEKNKNSLTQNYITDYKVILIFTSNFKNHIQSINRFEQIQEPFVQKKQKQKEYKKTKKINKFNYAPLVTSKMLKHFSEYLTQQIQLNENEYRLLNISSIKDLEQNKMVNKLYNEMMELKKSKWIQDFKTTYFSFIQKIQSKEKQSILNQVSVIHQIKAQHSEIDQKLKQFMEKKLQKIDQEIVTSSDESSSEEEVVKPQQKSEKVEKILTTQEKRKISLSPKYKQFLPINDPQKKKVVTIAPEEQPVIDREPVLQSLKSRKISFCSAKFTMLNRIEKFLPTIEKLKQSNSADKRQQSASPDKNNYQTPQRLSKNKSAKHLEFDQQKNSDKNIQKTKDINIVSDIQKVSSQKFASKTSESFNLVQLKEDD